MECCNETTKCRFLSSRKFGLIPCCMLYLNVELIESDKNAKRCDDCLKEFGTTA